MIWKVIQAQLFKPVEYYFQAFRPSTPSKCISGTKLDNSGTMLDNSIGVHNVAADCDYSKLLLIGH